MAEPLNARPARVSDAPAIAAIYNPGQPPHASRAEPAMRAFEAFVYRGSGERDGRIAGFAWAGEYRPRRAGRLALATLIDAAEARGFTKLVSRIFPENLALRRLDGKWPGVARCEPRGTCGASV